MSDLKELALLSKLVCEKMGWSRGWQNAGCYLHLEASEFIEALRGKGESPPEAEAADVLFVLLSTCLGNNIDLDDVSKYFKDRCQDILDGGYEK